MLNLITDNLDIWASAELPAKTGGRGRAASSTKSPHGIQKLRELILELAVRGKLVEQDVNDEPASELLRRIRAEKAKLIAEGKIKKDKPLSPISDLDKPFELLQGWEWVRLGFITKKLTDGSHNPPRDAGFGLPMLSSQNVNFGKIDFDSPSRFVSAEDFESENSRTKIEQNDILLTIVGSLGRSAVVPQDAPKFVLQRSVAVINTELFSEFLCMQLAAPFCMNYYEMHGKGTAQKGIYLRQLSEMPIAVPPLLEQHRIVAKVDELMALCDQLEQKQTDSSNAHQALVEILLATLTQAEGDGDFAAAWRRIAAHFDTLFTTEKSIDQLKQTILQLAVMGKLVSQDPSDESASYLLKKIAAEKSRLIKEKKIKKQEPLPEISDDEKSFEIPTGWTWCRLGETGIGATGKTPSTKEEQFFGGSIPFVGPGQITLTGELLSPDKTLTEEGVEQSTEALPNDILMVCIGGSIGKSVIVDKRIAFNQQINAIRPMFVNSVFLNTALSTNNFYRSVLDAATGSATPIINRSKWEELLVPIAPEAEQLRIVAKVDELMALCGALKNCLNEAQITQVQLADAIVEQAVA